MQNVKLPVMVVSYRNSTSNHNYLALIACKASLYLIEILHQTTTECSNCAPQCCCILSKFYIKPQRKALYGFYDTCCILSKFYIKPQLRWLHIFRLYCCILSKFYIKPQLSFTNSLNGFCCILSKFYIKPQQHRVYGKGHDVVSYRNSTSNHNGNRCPWG